MIEHAQDVVIIGAGAAGLLAAVAAKRMGYSVLVLESSALVGGDTALATGQLWLPATHLGAAAGVIDSEPEALAYLNQILGEETTASTAARRQAFVNVAPKLANWLANSNLPLVVCHGVPDYHPASVGGLPEGRVIATTPSDRRNLGEWAARMRSKNPVAEAGQLTSFMWQLTNSEGQAATGGEALVAELLRRATANGVEIWLEAEILGFDADASGVYGVKVACDGEEIEVKARTGVLLSAGGFAGNQELRQEFLPLPTDAQWSLMSQNTGKLLKLAANATGADFAAMSDAWWTPVTLIGGRAWSLDVARKAPHSIIVDQAGDRFFDEAAPPSQIVKHLYSHSRGVKTVPSFMIMDNRHHKSVSIGPWNASTLPGEISEPGEIIRANTLNDLAVALGIDRAGLIGTIVRFNGFAHKGEDTDFHRGESVWDRYALSSSKKPTSLGKIDKKPFWAVKVYPGDEGTKGGLRVDEHSQVLRPDGTAIPGFYACGGAAASIMKGTSPGPGAALSEALIQAFVAVISMDGKAE
ncbi:MAG: FAD-dependent oxidoreductase [Propionibacteriaceae bacterium]|jgi:3-oxosteroid 1-dehydrogenase|nr:FAD-dependent oxidoreductase [Propionibacteriaceae bacterium]